MKLPGRKTEGEKRAARVADIERGPEHLRKMSRRRFFGRMATGLGTAVGLVAAAVSMNYFFLKYDLGPWAGVFNPPKDEQHATRFTPPQRIPTLYFSDMFKQAPWGMHAFSPGKLPISYLLVRHENDGEPRCLSFVQETFEMIFGIGSAERVGLYGATFAQGLAFSGRPVRVEKFDPRNPLHTSRLPTGAVLRLSSEFDDEMCSIAIHVGGGKIMHLVYETLYVERIAGRMADEYRPRQVLFPDSSFTKVEMATGMGRHVFSMADGSKPTLARIAASVIRATPALAAAKVNMVEETIYMLNKDKFMLGRVYSSEDRCWEKGAILRQRADRLRMPIPWHVPEEW